MATAIIGALVGIGTAAGVGGGGVAAGITGGAIAAGTVASTGIGIAQAAGAFDPKAPNIPQIDDPAIGEERSRQRLAAARASGRSSQILAGPGGVDESSSLLARPRASGPGGPGGL